jgi:carboxypeptidase A
MINQFSSWFDAEKPPTVQNRRKDVSNFDQYYTFDEIMTFLDSMHANHQSNSELLTIGKSFEGRDIRGIKITKNESLPIIFIDANIHAREWISSATAVWLINELLTTNDAQVREVIDSMTWIIFPVLNPDGKLID